MNFFRDTSISIKVLIPPIILVLALGVISVFSINRLYKQHGILIKVHDIALKKITLIDEFILISEKVQSDVYFICVLKFMNVHEQEIYQVRQHLEQGLSDIHVIYGEILTKWRLDPAEKKLLENIQKPMNAYRRQAQQAAVSVLDKPSFGIFLVRSSNVSFMEFRQALGEFLDYQKLMIIRAEKTSLEIANITSIIILIISIIIIATSIITILIISTRLISKPILNIAGLMHRLAKGDLSIEVRNLKRRDEIGSMVRALDVFKKNAIENARLYEQARRDAETRAVLLREVNHRVKNNLAAIIGLIYTERRYHEIRDTHDYYHFLDTLLQRIRGLATVHKLLSASEWTPLSLKTLLEHLIQFSFKIHSPDKHIDIQLSVSDIVVTPDEAHNLSIVINELLTNSMKHSIIKGKTAGIIISAQLENDVVLLKISDNGPGYPMEVVQMKKYNMGMDLIENIVKKNLRGEVVFFNNPGASVEIKFRKFIVEELS